MTLKERKLKLQLEIESAEYQLSKNLENLDIKDYLETPSIGLPDLNLQSIQSATNVIPQVDAIARNILPKDNIIRSILRYTNLVIKGLEIVRK